MKDVVLSDSELIRTKIGGTLNVTFSYKGKTGKVDVNVTLKIPAGALPNDQVLTMSVDEQTLSGFVDLTFGPHGTMFLTPALLNINATGLDLSSVPPNAKVQLYYYNPTTNTYELMVVKNVFIDLKNGAIKCQDGQLPHFSRYAFGYVK
jgi:hypothetical protein